MYPDHKDKQIVDQKRPKYAFSVENHEYYIEGKNEESSNKNKIIQNHQREKQF